MGPSHSSPMEHGRERVERFVEWRAVLVGVLMCVLIAFAGPYWTFYLQTSRMFADYHLAGATFGLFILFVVFNLGLGTLWRGFAFSAHELMVVGAMMMVGGSIVTSGVLAYFIPTLAAPHYFATPANDYIERLWPNLAEGFFPLDPTGSTFAVRRFWEGLPPGEPIPWGPWVSPLLLWGVFLMAMCFCMVAIMALMRKQWIDYEHLSFPIAQVPGELCRAAADPWGRDSIFRSIPWLLGFGLTFLLANFTGVIMHYDLWDRTTLPAQIELAPGYSLPINLRLVIVGLVFLVPNRVAFSVWFASLAGWFLQSFMDSYNLALTHQGIYGSEMSNLAMGGAIVFVIISLWLSRRHLRRAVFCALGSSEQRDYDREEATSYRAALLVIMLCVGVMVWWFHRAGLGVAYGALILAITLAVFYVMSRVVAQCGLPMLSPPIYPNQFLTSMVGAADMSRSQITGLAMNHGWTFDMRNSAMAGAAHGLHLTRRRRRGLMWAMLLALLIVYAVGSVWTIRLCYRHGGVNMDGWFFDTFPKYCVWPWANNAIVQNPVASYARLAWAGAGAVLMAGLTLAQRTLFWWPFHPVGVLVASSHMVRFFWFSVFLAWLLKWGTVSLAGPAGYRKARLFMIGMVTGYFLGGGLWCLLDTWTESIANAVFYI